MTTAHTSPTFQLAPRRGTPAAQACLRLRWLVMPQALDRKGRTPITLELALHAGQGAHVLLDGVACEPARHWPHAWDGVLGIRRVCTGPGAGLVIADASPLAVAVFDPTNPERPLHVACDLPGVLGLAGGWYELDSGGLEGA